MTLGDTIITIFDRFQSENRSIMVTDNPNGDGKIIHRRNGQGGYDPSTWPGPKKGQRRHTFHDPQSFAAWLIKHASPETTEILLDADKRLVSAGLDPKDCGSDYVLLALAKHPYFSMWEQVWAKTWTAQDLIGKLRALVDTFEDAVGPKGGSLGNAGTLIIGELMALGVVIEGEFQHQLDETGYARFSGGNTKRTISARIPPEFKVTMPVFRGIPDFDAVRVYEFEILVSTKVVTRGEKPPEVQFVLICPKLEIVLDQATSDAVEYITQLLSEQDFLVGRGEYCTDEVPE